MVEHLGSDILAQPREIVAFVAHALDAEVGEPDGAKGAEAEQGRKEKREEEKERGGLAGLRIVELEEDDGRQGLGEKDEDEDEDVGLGTGFGRDEMAMTALTLLLAVLEGAFYLSSLLRSAALP